MLHLLAELVGDFLERRRDHPARPAPLGPEIHEHRLVRLEDIGVEAGVGGSLSGHGNVS